MCRKYGVEYFRNVNALSRAIFEFFIKNIPHHIFYT